MPVSVAQFRAWDERSWAESPKPDLPLLRRISLAAFERASPTPLEALRLRYSEAYLRPDQLPPPGEDWLTWMMIGGRGTGKSTAAAHWVVRQIETASTSQEGMLVGETDDDVWALQIRGPGGLLEALPPWIRVIEQQARQCLYFPDHGPTTIHIRSAQKPRLRGHNLRFAWADELTNWPHGEELWMNLENSLRVSGPTPPRAVATCNPPQELGWIVAVAMAASTRVYRNRMRDNPMLDRARVLDAYEKGEGTPAGLRELEGEIVLGGDGVLFKVEVLDQHRVPVPPPLARVVVAVDPAQSGKKDADRVGVVAAGESKGHLYVLESYIDRMAPAVWSELVLQLADKHSAAQLVVEPTGSGDYPRHTLATQMRLLCKSFPILEAKARGRKDERAAPSSALAAAGRLHIVGTQAKLEQELTTWAPGAKWSPGGLDALVHAVHVLTRGHAASGSQVTTAAEVQGNFARGLSVQAARRSAM